MNASFFLKLDGVSQEISDIPFESEPPILPPNNAEIISRDVGRIKLNIVLGR